VPVATHRLSACSAAKACIATHQLHRHRVAKPTFSSWILQYMPFIRYYPLPLDSTKRSSCGFHFLTLDRSAGDGSRYFRCNGTVRRQHHLSDQPEYVGWCKTYIIAGQGRCCNTLILAVIGITSKSTIDYMILNLFLPITQYRQRAYYHQPSPDIVRHTDQSRIRNSSSFLLFHTSKYQSQNSQSLSKTHPICDDPSSTKDWSFRLWSSGGNIQPIFFSSVLYFLFSPELDSGIGRSFGKLGMFFRQHPLIYQLAILWGREMVS
jgi:hypothetical protein